MMLRMLKAGSAECDRFLDGLSLRRTPSGGAVDHSVAAILAKVRRDGDRALISYTHRFDGVKLTLASLRVTQDEIDAALASLPRADRRALELAARRIAAF